MEKRGKTTSITNRFPHFYDGANVESLLYQFIDVFGVLLEQGETDLLAVMRSHHVDTADNEGSQGFIANKKGDLDQLFALYLEALGGTSQLVQVSHQFSPGSLKNVSNLAKKLHEGRDELSQYLRSQLDHDTKTLLERYQVSQAQFNLESFRDLPGLAIKLLVATVATDQLSHYLKIHLPPETLELLNHYDGFPPLPEPLEQALVQTLNQQLLNPSLYRKNKPYFQTLTLGKAAQPLLAQQPIGEDRQRLNRLLLEAAYPDYISPSPIPTLAEVEQGLINGLNRCLQDPSLYQKTYQDTDQPRPETPPQGNDLIIQNRQLLEAAYPNEIAKSYAPYRERLKGLIQILRQGAATKQGIIDLVAANLGILGDSPAAQAAKETIEIKEFMPRLTQLHPHNQPEHSYVLRLGAEFEVYNPNPQPEKIEIFLAVQPSLPVVLYNLRVVRCDTEESVTYQGEARASDVLSFRENTVEVNGKPYATEGTPQLPTQTSRWRLEAQLAEGVPLARFDQQRFGETTFALSQPAVSLEMRFYKLTPGVFEVKIPWDIPGFTDKFQQAGDHPRHQIAGIIDKVKAAGVLGMITYEKRFQETHEMVARLGVERSPFLEEHLAEDTLTISSLQVPYPEGVVHEMSDNLLTCGVFDYTGFDSGNGFG
ncbi:MAG: hypothetical protein F6K53_10305 [Moorea sp. SIO4A1]|uniref:hypothetical protein n=1 Tax=Moorena sp. SIO4A1 TaxID=2607835 RepID=UPI00144EB1FD|nr:hypothetical protein [Moorena sp. SIO4A1]NEQ57776.1 hypothetical protein [Moorena sp. SIO4A1]